jgi:hypothetical protein
VSTTLIFKGFIFYSRTAVVTAQTTIDDILITLQNRGLFHPTDIGYGLYTAASRFRRLVGATTVGDLRSGPQTHFHLRYLLLGGSGMYLPHNILSLSIILTYSSGRIVSNSDGEEATATERPKRSRTAASKVVDPSNRSTPALTSHRDAATAAKLAAAKVLAAKAAAAAVAGSSGSLSTAASTSNSCSISPGKRNADDAALSSKSSEPEEDIDMQKGKMTSSAIIFVAQSEFHSDIWCARYKQRGRHSSRLEEKGYGQVPLLLIPSYLTALVSAAKRHKATVDTVDDDDILEDIVITSTSASSQTPREDKTRDVNAFFDEAQPVTAADGSTKQYRICKNCL